MRINSAARAARAAAAAVTLAALAACTEPLPVAQPDPEQSVAPAAATPEQLERVLADVGAALAAADEAASVDPLAPRVAGPAATMRAAEYTLQEAGDADAVTPVPTGIQTLVTPATAEWPRTVMAVTEPSADLQPPLLLALTQEDPRDAYTLQAWVRLFPGVEMPATTQPEIGSAPVTEASPELSVATGEVLARYLDVLTNGAESEFAATFDEDPLRTGILATRDAYAELVAENGSLSQTYAVEDAGPWTMSTADGGAIVMGAFRTQAAITLVDSTLTIGDETAAFLGTDTVTEDLGITWLSMVAFAVPPAGSDAPVTVLGAEHSPVAVSGK